MNDPSDHPAVSRGPGTDTQRGVVDGTGLRPSARPAPRALDRELQELIPGDRVTPSGTVELRSGAWHWTLRFPEEGDPIEGATLLLTDGADPRRRMEVPGLPRNGVSESEVPYFARRAEVRSVPAGPGEYVVRVLRRPIDLATPFGTRIGLRFRVQTPAGSWREGTLSPGVRLGDLTDEEVRVTADRARPVVRGGL